MPAELHVAITGEGRDVIVLHGSPQDPEELSEFVSGALPGTRVLTPHMPGYRGSAEVKHDAADPLALAAIERALAPKLAGPAPILFGMSGGAHRALAIASRNEIALGGLVVIGAYCRMDDATAARLRGGADAVDAGVDLRDALLPGWFSASYLEVHLDEAKALVARYIDSVRDPKTFAAELRALAAAPAICEHLGAVELPAVVAVGELDLATPPAHAREVAQHLPGARLQSLPGLAHLAHVEDARAVRGVLERFVASVDG